MSAQLHGLRENAETVNSTGQEKEGVATSMWPFGTTQDIFWTNIQEIVKYTRRNRLRLWRGMRKLNVCDMGNIGRQESCVKTIARVGDRGCPSTEKKDTSKIINSICL